MRSLLNRNAAGAFRFSHYSIQEFLGSAVLDLDFGRLDLTGLQPESLAAFGFRDRLKDGGQGPSMQLILPGELQVGSPADDKDAYEDERPQHRVTIGRAFALGRYPVTFEEYDRFAEPTGRKKPDDNGWGRGGRPVINVSRQPRRRPRLSLCPSSVLSQASRSGGGGRFRSGRRGSRGVSQAPLSSSVGWVELAKPSFQRLTASTSLGFVPQPR